MVNYVQMLYCECSLRYTQPNKLHIHRKFNLPGVSEYLNQLDTPDCIDNEAEVKPREERMGDVPQEAHDAQKRQLDG